MWVILLIGGVAFAATAFGLFLSRARSGGHGRVVAARGRAKPRSSGSGRHQEMADLFSARLRSGAIGIPDLIRVFRNEGADSRAVADALLDAMSRFPQFARRKDKLEAWLKEGQRSV